LRADFYGQAAGHPELLAVLRDRQLLVEPMTPEELRAVIEQPAASAGLVLDDGLANVILYELGATTDWQPAIGALPLSHVLCDLATAQWITAHRRGLLRGRSCRTCGEVVDKVDFVTLESSTSKFDEPPAPSSGPARWPTAARCPGPTRSTRAATWCCRPWHCCSAATSRS
jgi:hypothetical protein